MRNYPTLSRLVSWLLIALELAALGVFLFSAHKKDSFLPGYGNSGDVKSMFLWSDRAEFAFSMLVALWLLAVTRAIYLAFLKDAGAGLPASERLGAVDAHAVALPVVGLIVGYIFLPTIG
jgi:hypothetical protein